MSDARESRPRPQYGEYADESTNDDTNDRAGEISHPSQSAGASDGSGAAGADPSVGALGDSAAPGSTGTASPESSRFNPGSGRPHLDTRGEPRTSNALPGVPHNLGVRDGSAAAPATASPAATPTATPPAAAPPATAPRATEPPAPQVPHNLSPGDDPAAAPPVAPQQHGEPYRATELPAQQGTPAHHPAAASTASSEERPKRTADRFVTIALLVLGAYGAMNSGYAMMQLGAEVTRLGKILGIDDFVAPSQVSTIGNVGAIIMLALYALVLIFSIRRLRARKLTFWAPLAIGAIAFVAYFALAIIAYLQSPELMEAMMRPDALQTVLSSFESQTS